MRARRAAQHRDKGGTGIFHVTCAACGKRSFMSKQDAKKAIRRYQGMGAGVKNLYRCPETGDWHVTSKEKRRIHGDAID